MPVQIITPEKVTTTNSELPHLFLAGSIEQGKAANWQQKAIQFFDTEFHDSTVVVVNPRREVWNAELDQTIRNDDFRFQVSFELEHLEKADAVIMWLEPGTLSPISLFELGLMAGWTSAGLLNKVVVGCPDGFWRKGNVEVVTDRYRIQLVPTFEELLIQGQHVLQRNHARRVDFEKFNGIR